ncbi:MAG: penicillin-binding protein 2 [Candidatus Pacebacteria bacterium]|nr:penicillin-binding protein 2 [Candidatus Paceibacterota bacterium]
MLGFPKNNLRIKRPGGEIETGDIFLDALAKKKDKHYEKIETSLSDRNFRLLSLFFASAFFLLLSMSFYLQIVKGGYYSERADKNKFVFKEIEAQRGIIYDRNLKQLVFNAQSFDLVCSPDLFSKDEAARERETNEAAKILNMPPADLNALIRGKEGKGEFTVSFDLDKEKVIVFKARAEEFGAFSIKKNQKREYIYPMDFAHILGFVSRADEKGGAGIEEYYDEELKEIAGIIETEKDVYGNIVKEEMSRSPESGENIVLNIDMDLQEKAAEIMAPIIRDSGAKSGTVIVMDPNTGAVLTMLTFPSYDNNVFSKNLTDEEYQKMLDDPNTSFFNRAVSGEYAIGSTVKPFLASGALKEGIITPETTIYCQGGIALKDGTFKNDWKAHGYVDLKKAIAESCDVYFYTISGGYESFKGLGIEKIDDYLQLFGFGEKTGIDINGEIAGFVPTPEWKKEETGYSWYPGDTYNISIGQGYLRATPLQLAVAVSAIANGGKIVKPQLVKSILDSDNEVITEFYPEIIREGIIEDGFLSEVRAGMRETVLSSSGTAHSLSYLSGTSAAKSGTAETSKKEVYHNLLTVFAPYENPEIVISAVIESVPYEQLLVNVIVRELLAYYFDRNAAEETSLGY